MTIAEQSVMFVGYVTMQLSSTYIFSLINDVSNFQYLFIYSIFGLIYFIQMRKALTNIKNINYLYAIPVLYSLFYCGYTTNSNGTARNVNHILTIQRRKSYAVYMYNLTIYFNVIYALSFLRLEKIYY